MFVAILECLGNAKIPCTDWNHRKEVKGTQNGIPMLEDEPNWIINEPHNCTAGGREEKEQLCKHILTRCSRAKDKRSAHDAYSLGNKSASHRGGVVSLKPLYV